MNATLTAKLITNLNKDFIVSSPFEFIITGLREKEER